MVLSRIQTLAAAAAQRLNRAILNGSSVAKALESVFLPDLSDYDVLLEILPSATPACGL